MLTKTKRRRKNRVMKKPKNKIDTQNIQLIIMYIMSFKIGMKTLMNYYEPYPQKKTSNKKNQVKIKRSHKSKLNK
jgi:hypothetical protein